MVTKPATSLSDDGFPTFSAPFLISVIHCAMYPGAQPADSSTPSPISPPSWSILGRTAVRYILTGANGTNPIFAPCTWNTSPWKLTVSPVRNRRKISTYSRIVFSGRGDSMPASFNAAAFPVPGLAITRPGANSSIVAMDMAEIIGWRE